ncbi:MAG: ABC transporter permease subunit, partial [Beijerinckiaceae bacterium]
MSFSGLLVQLLNGLSGASTLFLIAVGLSLIFGVTRIVNFAHGSLYMLGAYLAWSLIERFGNSYIGFWGGVFLAVVLTGVIGAIMEVLLLRRIYRAPELFQLLATFAVTLIIRDAVLKFWGPEDLLGPRAPGLRGSVDILGRAFPIYDLFLIVVGPVVLGLLWLLLTKTRFGLLVRAATQDRDMVAALGVNQSVLFTAVFALGAALAALGGALQLPRETANLNLDLTAIGDAFVVVVVGGMGSIPGAYLAALLIAEIKALCIAIGTVTVGGVTLNFSKFTLVAEFVVMAIVLIVRPWGLLGKPAAPARFVPDHEEPLTPFSRRGQWAALTLLVLLLALPLLTSQKPYTLVLGIDVLIAVLFAASLHMIMGPAGMHSFGHAAYFGLGAYGAGMALKLFGLPMLAAIPVGIALAGLGAALCGWFSV